MKAVVLYEKGKAELREIEKPIVGEEDILLQVEACGICGSDLHFYYGGLDPIGELPFVMGHEFAGVIVEKGERVDECWNVGDRIVSDNTGGACGTCFSCSNGNFVACSNRKTLGVTMDGGFAKYVKIPGEVLKLYKNCIWKIPDSISFEEATLMDPAANGYNAVIQQGGLKSGEVVVVFGVGALGLMSIAQAHLGGASQVIAVGMKSDRGSREEMALHYGAKCFLASDEEGDIAKKILEVVDGEEIAIVVDAVGMPVVMDAAVAVVRTEGTIVRIGMSSKPYGSGLDIFTIKNVSLKGHMGYNQISWNNTLALAKSGRLDLKSIISCELPLEEFHKGFEMSRKQEAAKVILIP